MGGVGGRVCVLFYDDQEMPFLYSYLYLTQLKHCCALQVLPHSSKK